MKNVKDIADMVIEIVDGKGYLFTWLPIELDRPLSLEAASFLSVKLSDLSSDSTDDFQRSMRSLSAHLHDKFIRSLADVKEESMLYREHVPDGGAAAQETSAMEVDSEEPVEETEAVALFGVLESDIIAMGEMVDRPEPVVARNFRIKPHYGSMFLSAMLQCLIAVDSVQAQLSVPGDTESPLSGPLRRILQESRRTDDSIIDPAELMTNLKHLDSKYTGRRDILGYTLFQDLLKFHTGLARLVTIRRTVRVVCEECGATSESEDSANCVDVPVGNLGDNSIDAATRGFFASKTSIER
ncbi:hypothetical protein HK405_003340 [Cladochytrium tenue]|nr:hypothetical protein HK405_003340 [Cladochytrium tenue]